MKKVLKNGMTVVLAPTDNTQIISIGFFINAGSRNETDENNGIAHFLEHMMFKGTKNRSAKNLFIELDTLGATYNAVTTSELTYYYLYGNSNDTKQLIDIMLDIYINSTFPKKEISNELKVIIEEMRMRSDSANYKLYSLLSKKFYKGTSLGRDIIGTVDTLSEFKTKDFVNFKNATYKPSRTVFVMTGNFSPNPIFKIIKPVLQSVPELDIDAVEYGTEAETILENMENQTKPQVLTKKNSSYKQLYALFVFPMFNLYDKHEVEIELITELLSGGFSSRLNHNLREKNGITYVSSAYPISYTDNGLFVIQLVLTPSELSNAIKIVMKILKDIKTNLIDEQELKKIQNITKNSILFSMTSPIQLLNYYGLNISRDRNFDLPVDANIKRIGKVKPEQLRNISNKIFRKEKLNIFLYGSVPKFEFNNIKL